MRSSLSIVSLLIVMILSSPEVGISQASGSSAESISSQLKTARDLHMSGEEQKSLNIYKDVLSKDADNITALWNAAVIEAKIGHRQNRERSMRRHYEAAQNLADRAVENHPDNGYAYYAKAVAVGRMTEIMDTGDKIDASRELKNNIEKASELIPDFAPVWHLYGVWHSDVANMSGAVKAAAGLFSSGIPDASNEKAEEYLQKAISMDEDNILIRLDLAKHYMKVGRPEHARPLLKEIQDIKPQMKDDPGYIKEAEQMLNEIE